LSVNQAIIEHTRGVVELKYLIDRNSEDAFIEINGEIFLSSTSGVNPTWPKP